MINLNEISRSHEMINKTVNGEIIIVDLGRKENVRLWVLTKENPKKAACTLKFASIEDIQSYECEYDWFKNSDYASEYEFLDLCYFTEKSRYGKGSDNRKNSK